MQLYKHCPEHRRCARLWNCSSDLYALTGCVASNVCVEGIGPLPIPLFNRCLSPLINPSLSPSPFGHLLPISCPPLPVLAATQRRRFDVVVVEIFMLEFSSLLYILAALAFFIYGFRLLRLLRRVGAKRRERRALTKVCRLGFCGKGRGRLQAVGGRLPAVLIHFPFSLSAPLSAADGFPDLLCDDCLCVSGGSYRVGCADNLHRRKLVRLPAWGLCGALVLSTGWSV